MAARAGSTTRPVEPLPDDIDSPQGLRRRATGRPPPSREKCRACSRYAAASGRIQPATRCAGGHWRASTARLIARRRLAVLAARTQHGERPPLMLLHALQHLCPQHAKMPPPQDWHRTVSGCGWLPAAAATGENVLVLRVSNRSRRDGDRRLNRSWRLSRWGNGLGRWGGDLARFRCRGSTTGLDRPPCLNRAQELDQSRGSQPLRKSRPHRWSRLVR